MDFFKIILFYEWRQLFRQVVPGVILIIFLLIGGYSIFRGREFTERQLSAIDSLRLNEHDHLLQVIARYHSDTSTAEGKIFVLQAGIPQIVEFRNPPYAINPPHGLAVMAIGQRDLLPFFDVVNSKRNYSTVPLTEIANPEKLAAGNFDLSFVLIYLFPLLIIIWCHDVLSHETELQTEKLLFVQGADVERIITYKLIFRLFMVYMLVFILSAGGFCFRPSVLRLPLKDAVLWLVLVMSYLLFWMVVCRLIIRFNYTSKKNATILSGIWIALLLLLPGLAGEVSDLFRPMPDKAKLAAKQREITNQTWEMPIPILLDTFYRNNPAYVGLRKPSDTAIYGNIRFSAYEDLLLRRLKQLNDHYYKQVNQHEDFLNRLNYLNPAVRIQYLLNADAETGLKDYYFFEKQVNDFQHTWVIYLNKYLLYQKKIPLNELYNLPRFKKQSDPLKITSLLRDASSLWIVIALLFLLTPKLHTRN